MKQHFTEELLIQYQFKLLDEKRTQQIKEHLEQCAVCRSTLQQIEQKFAVLDVVREDVTASEELIARILARVAETEPVSKFYFQRWAWASAAAVMIVIAVALIMKPTEKPPIEIAKAPQKPVVTGEIVEDVVAEKTEGIEEYIPDKPPFAPASNIELTTLPKRENVQITIYNSADLTLVRERRNLTMKKGWNWMQFMWANTLIDPTSLSLEPLEHANKISLEQMVFPPRLSELARWLIKSEISGQVPFEITYFTSGLSWRAFYMGTMAEDEKTMTLNGYVRVTNKSGEDYESAQTRLIVGKVHLLDQIADLAKRKHPYNRPGETENVLGLGWTNGKPEESIVFNDAFTTRLHGVDDYFFADDKSAPKEIKKEGLSEYFLYTIEGTETIPTDWAKRLPSFTAENVPIKGLYKYDEERWSNNTIRFVSFINDEEHELGQTPIPNGNVKIYRTVDAEKRLSYVGGADVKYIPVNEKVELELGPAQKVTVKPKQMNILTENYLYNSDGNVSGWDEVHTWQITVTNTSTLPVDIEITRGFGTNYWSMDAVDGDVIMEKHDQTHARFLLNVPPRTVKTFTYILRTNHGDREQTFPIDWKLF